MLLFRLQYGDVAGEFGLGVMAMPLVPLNDCHRNSYYMDGVFVTSDAKPYVMPNIICLFEQYAGDIAWRHCDKPIIGPEVHDELISTLPIYIY